MILCFLRLHKWSSWSAPYFLIVEQPNGWGDKYEKEITVQDRVCAGCSKIQDRVVSGGVRQE